MEYRTIPTTLGRAKLEQAALLQVPLELTLVEFGDGNGAEYLPTGLETALKRKVYEAAPNMLADAAESETWVELHAVLPFDVGGWWLREFIVRDAAGDAIFIGNLPESFKPIGSTGAIKDIAFELVFDILSPDSVTLKVDPSKVLATRKYVEDYVAQELAKLDAKQSVRAATTAPINLSTLQIVDGVQLAAGDRVLVKNMVDAKLNGIYVAAAGNWVRAADADASAEVTSAMIVSVEQGATLADTRWQLVTDGLITLGATGLSFQDVTKGYAPLSSPAFTDNPTAPTAPQFDSDTSLANTAFVQRALGNIRGVGQTLSTSGTLVLTAADVGLLTQLGGTSTVQTLVLPDPATLPGGSVIRVRVAKAAGSAVIQTPSGVIATPWNKASVTSFPTETSDTYEFICSPTNSTWMGVSRGGGFFADLSANGYQKLSSGLIKQWGAVIVPSGGSVDVTLPVAFPTGGLRTTFGRQAVSNLSAAASIGYEYLTPGSLRIYAYSTAGGNITVEYECTGR